MKRVLLALAAMSAAAGHAAQILPHAAKPQVTVVEVNEVRSTSPRDSGPTDLSTPGLYVRLRVDGVGNAARHGALVITEAADDVGTRLAPPGPAGDPGEAVELFHPESRGSRSGPAAPSPFFLQFKLGLPARQARRVASLKGELRLAAGGNAEGSVVRVPGVESLRGKAVDYPDLARVGVSVQVGAQGRIHLHDLPVLVSGTDAQDVDVGVVDAGGKSISSGSSGNIGQNSVSKIVRLNRPLLGTDVLTIHLPAGRHAVTIPIELRDLALP